MLSPRVLVDLVNPDNLLLTDHITLSLLLKSNNLSNLCINGTS